MEATTQYNCADQSKRNIFQSSIKINYMKYSMLHVLVKKAQTAQISRAVTPASLYCQQ